MKKFKQKDIWIEGLEEKIKTLENELRSNKTIINNLQNDVDVLKIQVKSLMIQNNSKEGSIKKWEDNDNSFKTYIEKIVKNMMEESKINWKNDKKDSESLLLMEQSQSVSNLMPKNSNKLYEESHPFEVDFDEIKSTISENELSFDSYNFERN